MAAAAESTSINEGFFFVFFVDDGRRFGGSTELARPGDGPRLHDRHHELRHRLRQTRRARRLHQSHQLLGLDPTANR